MDCIFCKIVEGSLPSVKVYEDEKFLAFMDISPIALGHILVIPKKHFRNALDTDAKTAAGFYPVIVKAANAVKKAYKADGINIMQFNEPSAGQEVFHSHVHIIPRYTGDDLGIKIPPRLKVSPEEIAAEAEKIKNSF